MRKRAALPEKRYGFWTAADGRHCQVFKEGNENSFLVQVLVRELSELSKQICTLRSGPGDPFLWRATVVSHSNSPAGSDCSVNEQQPRTQLLSEPEAEGGGQRASCPAFPQLF